MTSMCEVRAVSVSVRQRADVAAVISSVSLEDDSLMFSPGFKKFSLAARI